MKKQRILLAAVSILTAASAWALTASEAFTSAPRSVFPLLDNNTRLDMVDYFNAGVQRPSEKATDGTSVITSMTPEVVTVKLSDASQVEICVLPASPQPIIMLITTVRTPADDSSVAFYTSDWKPLASKGILNAPTLDDWLTDKSKRIDVEMTVPFMLASAKYNGTTGELVFTNNLATFLTNEVYKDIAPVMRPSITYKWNNKSFSKVR